MEKRTKILEELKKENTALKEVVKNLEASVTELQNGVIKENKEMTLMLAKLQKSLLVLTQNKSKGSKIKTNATQAGYIIQ